MGKKKKKLTLFFAALATLAMGQVAHGQLPLPGQIVEIHFYLEAHNKKFEILNPKENKNYPDEESEILGLMLENVTPRDLRWALQKCSQLFSEDSKNKDDFSRILKSLKTIAQNKLEQKLSQQTVIQALTQQIIDFTFTNEIPVEKHKNSRGFFNIILGCPMDTTDDD